jgi:uncharacterized membrane protein
MERADPFTRPVAQTLNLNTLIYKEIGMLASITRFTNIILAALLAGTSFGIWMGLNPTQYSPATYLEQQQQLVGSLNTLMVLLVIFAAIVTIISALLQRKNKGEFIILLAASAFFTSCLFISRFGNVPIQNEILTWSVDSLPGNWTDYRDRWWTFHILRTVAELIALTMVAWTLAKNSNANKKHA